MAKLSNNLSCKVYPKGSRPQVTLEWHNIGENESISIFEESNTFIIERIWEKIKQFIMTMIFEGDEAKIIHHCILDDPDSKELFEYFEIEIQTPHLGEGLSEDFISAWYCNVISFLKLSLMKLNIPFEEEGPDELKAREDNVLNFLKKSKGTS